MSFIKRGILKKMKIENKLLLRKITNLLFLIILISLILLEIYWFIIYNEFNFLIGVIMFFIYLNLLQIKFFIDITLNNFFSEIIDDNNITEWRICSQCKNEINFIAFIKFNIKNYNLECLIDSWKRNIPEIVCLSCYNKSRKYIIKTNSIERD